MSPILVATTLAPALLLRVASVVLSAVTGFGALVAALDVTQWLDAVSDSFWTYVILGASAIVRDVFFSTSKTSHERREPKPAPPKQ